MMISQYNILHDRPVPTNGCNGFKAAWCQLVWSSETTVHGPVEQIDLVWIQFQEQYDHLTAKTVHLVPNTNRIRAFFFTSSALVVKSG